MWGAGHQGTLTTVRVLQNLETALISTPAVSSACSHGTQGKTGRSGRSQRRFFPEFPAPMAVRPALVSGELESGFLPSWVHCPLPLSHRPPLPRPHPSASLLSFLLLVATSPLPPPTGLSKSPISLPTRAENYKFKCSAKGAGGSVGR